MHYFTTLCPDGVPVLARVCITTESGVSVDLCTANNKTSLHLKSKIDQTDRYRYSKVS